MAKTKARRSSSASSPLPAAGEAASVSCEPLQSATSEASGLIGHHPLTLTVNAVEDSHRPGCSSLWLSEAAMLEASFLASQLVAVAVKASCSNDTSIRVESLEERVSRQHCLKLEEISTKAPGAYVVVAVVWPSQRLNRYGAKLSKQLACTLGSPLVGLSIFVSSIKADCRNPDLERKWNVSSHHRDKPDLLICECKSLYLKWCLPTVTLEVSEKPSSTAIPILISHEDSLSSVSSPSCQIQASAATFKQSPVKAPPDARTPGEQKFQSPEIRNSLPLGIESKSNSKERGFGKEEKQRDLWKPVWSIFEKEAGKAKMIVEAFAAKWLQGCIFLSGNLILIPHCGLDCVFQIKEAQTLPDISEEVKTSTIFSHESSEEAITAKFGSLALTPSPQPAFYVSQKTKVSLLPPFDRMEAADVCQASVSVSQAPDERGTNAVSARIAKYSSLGGLSEQISTLREIMELSLLRPHHLMHQLAVSSFMGLLVQEKLPWLVLLYLKWVSACCRLMDLR